MVHKIDLDATSLEEIVHQIHEMGSDTFVFYNSRLGTHLNKQLIFSLIFFLGKHAPTVSYFFYNIPFCVFKNLGKIYVDTHCIRNRLCNSYDGYHTENKCNRCMVGLFCNNFNSRIPKGEIENLEGWYDTEYIQKEALLEKIGALYSLVLSLGYLPSEVSFYMTQKFMIDFLEGDFPLAREFLRYFTVYFFLENRELTKQYFIDPYSASLVFRDSKIEKATLDLLKEIGINVNYVYGKRGSQTQTINYKDTNMRLNYYYSVDIYRGKREFFDFKDTDIEGKIDTTIFSGSVFNQRDLVVRTSVWLIKKAGDLYTGNSEVYIGRDIISGLNINTYTGLLLTSDHLGERGRFSQSLSSIEIPVIYNITPNIMEILENNDQIEIDFSTGIIKKCH